LMRLYQEIFEKSGLTVSQVLVTRQDFGRRTSYLSLQRTLSTLLKWNAVPVINENDALAADEIRFGDNDILAALVSAKMQTSHLLLLTQTEGFIKDGCVVPVIDRITPEIKAFCSGKSCLGSGGMKSKLEAAHIARKSGASTFIFAGAHPEYISEILLEKKGHGTCIPAEKRLSAKKQWLAYSSLVSGTISVDRGAEEALVKKGRSMLPSGIMKVSGEFGRGDVVGLTGGNGTVFARGITSYSSSEIEKIRGRRSSEIEKILGYTRGEEVIHRDNLTLEHA
ncbi:MAG TPA: glutamate 5-kinase, partial [bacterium]|nr:glutamate 5-kinase [bacterium]